MAKLVSIVDGTEIRVGDHVKTFRGEEVLVQSWSAPHKPGSQGRVVVCDQHGDHGHYIGAIREFYPSVINAKFVD